MNGYLKIRNWDKWQSYRKGRGQPPWIKVHRSLLRNPEWASLTDAQKGHLVSIWMLAADREGEVPSDPDVVRQFCVLKARPEFQVLIDKGFIEADASMAPEQRQDNDKTTTGGCHNAAGVAPQRRSEEFREGQSSTEEDQEREREEPDPDPSYVYKPPESRGDDGPASEMQINMLKVMADEARTGLDDLAESMGYAAITRQSVDPIKARLKEIKRRNRRRRQETQ